MNPQTSRTLLRRRDMESNRLAALRFLVFGLAGVAYWGAPSRPADLPATAPPARAWVPAGEFRMGSDDRKARSDEHPMHQVRVSGFWMDQAAVTNAQFQRFVEATGYVTVAER